MVFRAHEAGDFHGYPATLGAARPDEYQAVVVWSITPACAQQGTAREQQLTTIHQAKGREWLVVCAAALHVADLRPNETDLLLGDRFSGLESRATRRSVEIDLVRQCYVAFTRAQRLLVLSCARQPDRIFRRIWGTATSWDEIDQSRLSDRGRFVNKETIRSVMGRPIINLKDRSAGRFDRVGADAQTSRA